MMKGLGMDDDGMKGGRKGWMKVGREGRMKGGREGGTDDEGRDG